MASSSSQENPPFREKNHESRSEPKASSDGYRKKYVLLKRRCEGIQLDNEKCLNRLYYVKKAVRQMSRERRFLMSKLNKYGDDYKNTTLPLPIEDDSMLHLMSINNPITPSFPASRGLAGLVTKSHQQQQQQQGGKVPARRGRVGRPRLISEMTSRDEEPAPTGRGNKRKRMMSQNPLAPKKPANAFLMFCQSKRQTLQEESASKDPEGGGGDVAMTHQEMTRQLAKKWNFLEAGEKEAYYNMYERDKDRYHKEMKEYIKSNNLEPNPLADPTPQPPADALAAVKKDPIVTDKQSDPRKELPVKQVKTEPLTEADCHSPLPAIGPSVSTVPSTSTSAKSAVKLEPTIPVKVEPKTTSLTADSGTHKLKSLHLKMTEDVDDPYHFDDD